MEDVELNLPSFSIHRIFNKASIFKAYSLQQFVTFWRNIVSAE
jgi:hypothetical protein